MESEEDELAKQEWPIKTVAFFSESGEDFLEDASERANDAANADDEVGGVLNT